MTDHGINVKETDWGLYIVMKEGVTVDDSNILPRIHYVIRICKERDKNKILLDARNTSRNVSVQKLFQGVQLMGQIGSSALRIALLAPHLVDDQKSKFVDNLGAHRSIYIRYFSEEKEAMNWLLGDGEMGEGR